MMAAVPAPPMAATILAAGLGSRLGGRPKATLEIGGCSLLERLASALRGAGIAEASVVIGPYRDALLPLAEHCGLGVLAHEKSDASLIDSQRLAVAAHAARSDGADLLLVLADLPLLTAAHVAVLLEAWRRRTASIHALMPVVDGARGHPLLLSRPAVQEIAASPGHLGVRDWLAAHPDALLALPTRERAHVIDLDTPEDLAALEARVHPARVSWPGRAA